MAVENEAVMNPENGEIKNFTSYEENLHRTHGHQIILFNVENGGTFYKENVSITLNIMKKYNKTDGIIQYIKYTKIFSV